MQSENISSAQIRQLRVATSSPIWPAFTLNGMSSWLCKRRKAKSDENPKDGTYSTYWYNCWMPTRAFSLISRLVRTASPAMEGKVFTVMNVAIKHNSVTSRQTSLVTCLSRQLLFTGWFRKWVWREKSEFCNDLCPWDTFGSGFKPCSALGAAC